MVFPGQDYNNSRVADFENVQAWTGNEQARTELGRMPWHDVHTMLTGPAVMDIAQFFVERWNFVRDLKYKHNDRFPLLDWPHDDPLNDQMLRHPHTGRSNLLHKHYLYSADYPLPLSARFRTGLRVIIFLSVKL